MRDEFKPAPGGADLPPHPGPMTRLAHTFVGSKITPLLALAMLLIGLFAIAMTPREEEPQIVVPMIDVMVMLPGASPEQIENIITQPLEQKVWEVQDVEYVYSASYRDFGMVTARYKVGTDMEKAITRLWNKILGNMDLAPMGIMQPIIKVRSIDDVPIQTLTLWSENYDLYDLRQIAGELRAEVAAIEDVSVVELHGGRERKVRVELDPQRMAALGITTLSVLPALEMQNEDLPAGTFALAGEEFAVETSAFLRDAEDVRNLVVGVHQDRPVRLMDIATVTDGPAEIDNYAFFGVGPRAEDRGIDVTEMPVGSEYPAVTLSVAKRKGSDATRVAEAVHQKVAQLEGHLLPEDVNVTVTRDYGETANEKAKQLLKSLGEAILLAMIVVFLAMGWRGSLIIFVSIPTTFALTLFVYYIFGYTLNRVTLFALILVTGLVVDDTIIVVENIHRHFQEKGRRSVKIVMQAVQEIGNPTILATLTVIASLYPMAFVSGLMGPYMKPMPVGASLAMIFSLFIAFIIAPWLAMRVIKPHTAKQGGGAGGTGGGQTGGGGQGDGGQGDGGGEHGGRPLQETRIYKLYNRVMRPLVDHPGRGIAALTVIGVITAASTILLFTRTVEVKMLPFDNKSEFQVIIDMPEGTTLEKTTTVARQIGDYLSTVPEVTDYQVYSGTNAPINFNGLVRHYMMRQGPTVADLQVNLVEKGKRSDQSHAIAKRVRGPIQEIAARHGAAVKVVEVPPGPPVLSTLVAEIYGPDHEGRVEVARQVKEIFETTPGVVDVDWWVEADQTRYRFVVDKERAAVEGVSAQQVSRTLAVALGGHDAALVHVEDAAEPVPVNLRLPVEDRSSVDALDDLFVGSRDGGLVPLANVVEVEQSPIPKSRHRRNLKPVVYVTADVAGAIESPVYAILDMKPRIAEIPIPSGVSMDQHFTSQPELTEQYAMKWDGEWHITYEVFRDLGAAFAVVIVIIYLLIVAMFQNFTVPLLMMLPVPLTLAGIIPGHLAFDAFFTATSMIGLIALAGIMVRNSVLLVDFIVVRQEQGKDLVESVIEAGAVRILPIALTAGTVVAASFVMVFDPIFQGLAISLMTGALVSTVLTLIVIPLAYFLYARGKGSSVRD